MDKRIEIILQLVQVLIVPLLLYAVRAVGLYLRAKTKSEEAKRLIELAQESMVCAVSETAQVYVDELKRTDDWDAQKAAKAKDLAVNRAREIMGERSYTLLNQAIGDAGAYLDALNEACVRADKVEKAKIA